MVWFDKYDKYLLILALLIVSLAIWGSYSDVIDKNGGVFTYTLDDTYNYMSLAKNIALHGVWGLTKYEFTSSSSNLIWLPLLAFAYKISGVHTITPFVLNTAMSFLFCVLYYALLRKYVVPSVMAFGLVLAMFFFAPIPALIFCSMDHLPHLLASLGFVYLSVKALSAGGSREGYEKVLLCLAPLLTMSRYEGLLLLLIVCFLFLLKRKARFAVLLGGLGLLPVTIYGLICKAQGGFFLPNSILIKESTWNAETARPLLGFLNVALTGGVQAIAATPHILYLIVPALIVYGIRYKKNRFWEEKQVMLGIFISMTYLHMQFAKTGWFHRYEAYLVAIGIFVLGITLGLMTRYGALALIGLFMLNPFCSRAEKVLAEIPQAAHNIYEQQYQMAEFVREFYQGKAIAENDTGVMTFVSDIKILDLFGLGTADVVRAKLHDTFGAREIDRLAAKNGIDIAIVYDHWFTPYGGFPPSWVKVGQWQIMDNIICGGDTVAFYAVRSSEKESLIKNLRKFSAKLPSDVKQAGMYTENL